jgi:hypothetical protein
MWINEDLMKYELQHVAYVIVERSEVEKREEENE